MHVLYNIQTLRNLANISGERISKLFAALDRRLKSSDKKDQSGVEGEGKGGGRRMQKTRKRPHDRETSSTSNIVPTH